MVTAKYMLDTNTVSYIIKDNPRAVRIHLNQVPMSSIYISSITEAELLTSVAKKPDAKHLPILVKEFLLRVTILPWDSKAAKSYADFRTAIEKRGKSLGTMDMLIAANSLAAGTILISNDKAFYQLADQLTLEDWTQPKG
ncbi:MAG: type II toxin-antitoxin system VapC family toxin [Enterobacterales bacterium]|nr:type II toxin-antitoxin system VapC family toxin [Enterobacterales bacterium]